MNPKNKLGRILSVLLMAAALSVSAFGQQLALTTTTLSTAAPLPAPNQSQSTFVNVASATNINPPQLPQSQGGIGSPTSVSYTFLYVDNELMQVNTVAGTRIGVERGVQGTATSAHNSGSTVYVMGGSQSVQALSRVQGGCNSATAPPVVPFIFPMTGQVFGCPSVGPYANNWVQTGQIAPPGTFVAADNTAAGASVLRVCHARYSFAVDGGTASTITPATNCTIPINAVIYKALINNVVAPIGSTGNVSVGLSAGGAGTGALLAATARGSLTIGTIFDGVPIEGSASTSNTSYIKMSAAGQVTVTVATNALTAGIMDVFVFYYVEQA